jgi:hypothetical protein
MMLKAAGVALLWLLTASVADAAPRSRVDRTQVCNGQTATIRKVVRRLKTLGGPLARTRKARTWLLFDCTPRLHRPPRAHVGDHRDAIQLDAAVAYAARDGRTIPGLCPVGIVAGPAEPHVSTLAFSPRSPRGPPPPV